MTQVLPLCLSSVTCTQLEVQEEVEAAALEVDVGRETKAAGRLPRMRLEVGLGLSKAGSRLYRRLLECEAESSGSGLEVVIISRILGPIEKIVGWGSLVGKGEVSFLDLKVRYCNPLSIYLGPMLETHAYASNGIPSEQIDDRQASVSRAPVILWNRFESMSAVKESQQTVVEFYYIVLAPLLAGYSTRAINTTFGIVSKEKPYNRSLGNLNGFKVRLTTIAND
ncbi:hypothetical protein BDZ91DRAFT_764932 [Kalaharituber pfeilii]|nr:hypothetical protein BDZ91DRAFT_764932 [Kalaharituber pfeilii]